MFVLRKILIIGLVLVPFFINRATPDDYDWDLDGDGDPTIGRVACNHANHSIFGAAVGTIMSNNPALQSFVTPAVRALVRKRLTKSGALVTANSQMSDKERLDAKIALLVVREVNPLQEFYPAEHALMRGICLKTIREKNDQRSTKSC
jgi:hypothetical protein